MQVDIGDLSLSCEVNGEAAPLLLIAGTGLPGATWLPEAVKPLAEHFTVIQYDQRGTGSSGNSGEPYSTRLLARDAARLIKALGVGPVHVLGHSAGGRVAQWLAIDSPRSVRTLVLAASGAGRAPQERLDSAQVVAGIQEEVDRVGYLDYIRRTQRGFFFTPAFVEENPGVADELADSFWQNRPSLETYLRHVVARNEHYTLDVLGRITQPTLVMVGDLDTDIMASGSHLEQAQTLAAGISHSEFSLVPGVKHGLFWERPWVANSVAIDWLRRQ